MLVTPLHCASSAGPYNTVGVLKAGEPFTHKVILAFIYADGPARSKLIQSMGSAGAYLACWFCWLAGTVVGHDDEDFLALLMDDTGTKNLRHQAIPSAATRAIYDVEKKILSTGDAPSS